MSEQDTALPERVAHITDPLDQMLVGTIVMLGEQKEALAGIDSIYPMTYPRLAATAEQVAAAEDRIGFPLDDLHRRLLMLADGWHRMSLTMHLLPAEALGAPGLWQDCHDHLKVFFSEVGDDVRFEQLHNVCPVGCNDQTDDIFLVRRDGPLTDGGHEVIWFADDIVQVFSNVIDWMLSMKAYVVEMVAKRSTDPR